MSNGIEKSVLDLDFAALARKKFTPSPAAPTGSSTGFTTSAVTC